METAMKRLAAVIALAALLPLGGCATPYGYSPGAWAYYDGDYDYGWDGYGGSADTGYGQGAPYAAYGNPYYGAPPYPGMYGPGFYGYPRGYGWNPYYGPAY
jgi:hypothetical protein